jgi:hypothetical protein
MILDLIFIIKIICVIIAFLLGFINLGKLLTERKNRKRKDFIGACLKIGSAVLLSLIIPLSSAPPEIPDIISRHQSANILLSTGAFSLLVFSSNLLGGKDVPWKSRGLYLGLIMIEYALFLGALTVLKNAISNLFPLVDFTLIQQLYLYRITIIAIACVVLALVVFLIVVGLYKRGTLKIPKEINEKLVTVFMVFFWYSICLAFSGELLELPILVVFLTLEITDSFRNKLGGEDQFILAASSSLKKSYAQKFYSSGYTALLSQAVQLIFTPLINLSQANPFSLIIIGLTFFKDEDAARIN